MEDSLSELNLQPRQPLQTQVYRALRKAIINSKLAPGSKLVESQLAARLRVSRNPVREALRQLEQDGLVVHTPNHGVTVQEIGLAQAAEIAVVREELEALSCRLAARLATPADIADLRRIIVRDSSSVASGDLDELITSEFGFHERLLQMTQNQTLIRLLAGLRDAILRFRRAAILLPDRPEEVVSEHAQVVDAMEAGDAATAEALLREHIRRSNARLQESVRSDKQGSHTGGG